jgi:hypothetical protein
VDGQSATSDEENSSGVSPSGGRHYMVEDRPTAADVGFAASV